MGQSRRLVLLKGLVGSGKSTLSRALGEHMGWPVIDKDDFSDVFIQRVEEYGPLAYAAMFSVAKSLLDQGFSVICDSPLRGEVGYLEAKSIADEMEAELCVIVCSCSDEGLWRRRIETRQRRLAHIIGNWTEFEAYRRRALPDYNYAVEAPTCTVDTANPLPETIEDISRWLQQDTKQRSNASR